MRNVTAASLVQQARIWTNTVGSKQPPDSDLLSLCNTSFAMWYEKIADATESDYWWEEYLFTTVSGVNNYLVPADQDRIRRVDSQVTQAPQNQRWVAVRRYDEAMKNVFGAMFGGPAMPANQVIKISYLPVPPFLSQYAFLTIPTADTFDSITFTATQAGLNGQAVQIQIIPGGGAGAAVVTVAGMLISVEVGSGCTAQTVVTAFNAVPAATYLASVACTQPNDVMVSVRSQAPLGGTLQFDFINGLDRYLVADMAALIAMRLGRDPSPWVAERERIEPLLTIRAAKRDSNEPQQCKDTMREQMFESGPFYAVFPYRFAYRVEGQYMDLRPFVA